MSKNPEQWHIKTKQLIYNFQPRVSRLVAKYFTSISTHMPTLMNVTVQPSLTLCLSQRENLRWNTNQKEKRNDRKIKVSSYQLGERGETQWVGPNSIGADRVWDFARFVCAYGFTEGFGNNNLIGFLPDRSSPSMHKGPKMNRRLRLIRSHKSNRGNLFFIFKKASKCDGRMMCRMSSS